MLLWILIPLIPLVPLVLYHFFRVKRKVYPHQRRFLPFEFPFSHYPKVIHHQEKTLGMAMNELYQESRDNVVAVYLICQPVVLVRDPKIVQIILAASDLYFSPQGMCAENYPNPVTMGLFTVKTFQSSLITKLATINVDTLVKDIHELSGSLKREIKTLCKDKSSVNVSIKDMSYKYSVDATTNVILGFQNEVIPVKNNLSKAQLKFLKDKNFSIWETLRVICLVIFPIIFNVFGIANFPSFIGDLLVNLLKRLKIGDHRENKTFVKKLMNMQKAGSMQECAQFAFHMYIRITEYSTSTICYCLFELSREPDHMRTLQAEIDRALTQGKGGINLETLNNMTFLAKCVQETLRKYPTLPMLHRRCNKDYKVQGTERTIYEGQAVIIPIGAILTDPNHFPNPLKFNPNRCDVGDPDYSEMTKHVFGDEPKIATDISAVIAKNAIISILSKFDIKKGFQGELGIPIGNLGLPPGDDFTLQMSMRGG